MNIMERFNFDLEYYDLTKMVLKGPEDKRAQVLLDASLPYSTIDNSPSIEDVEHYEEREGLRLEKEPISALRSSLENLAKGKKELIKAEPIACQRAYKLKDDNNVLVHVLFEQTQDHAFRLAKSPEFFIVSKKSDARKLPVGIMLKVKLQPTNEQGAKFEGNIRFRYANKHHLKYKYCGFISYRFRDNEAGGAAPHTVHIMKNMLENDGFFPIFEASDDLKYVNKYLEELCRSQVMLVIVTKSFFESTACIAELLVANCKKIPLIAIFRDGTNLKVIEELDVEKLFTIEQWKTLEEDVKKVLPDIVENNIKARVKLAIEALGTVQRRILRFDNLLNFSIKTIEKDFKQSLNEKLLTTSE